ncbi:MAG: tetratricopeptide repeat protein [Sulfurospirillum sp.]|nr:tetratricopeptide repeat protein [Sulfurospirillum sp.]
MRFIFSVIVVFMSCNVYAQEFFGICKIDTLDTNGAITYIEKILEKNPENLECMITLASLYLKKGKLEAGFEYVSRAYKFNALATQKSSLAPIVRFALNMEELRKKAYKNNTVEDWNKLGDAYFEFGAYDMAADFFQTSFSKDATQEQIGLKLAQSYKKIAKTHEAIIVLKQVLQYNPNNFYANYFIGKILKYSSFDATDFQIYLKKAEELLEKDKKLISNPEYPKFINDILYELGS